MKPAALSLILACSAISAWAGEFAVLANGARLYADHHASDGAKVTLFTKTGSTELDASLVTRFENEDYAPPQVTRAGGARVHPVRASAHSGPSCGIG